MFDPNKKYTVLIVDDDNLTLAMYSQQLSIEKNFVVITAKDGVEAFDKMTQQIPDLVFTGIIMPRLDGFGLIELMRKDARLVNVPIVLSSHLGRQEDKERALGMDIKHFIIRDQTTLGEVAELIKSILLKSGAKFTLKLDLSASDTNTEEFLKENFESLVCETCNTPLTKIILTIELFHPKKLYSVIKKCDNCDIG